MKSRPWSKQKIEKLAGIFIAERDSVVVALKEEIRSYELLSSTNQDQTNTSRLKDIIEIIGDKNTPITADQLKDIFSLGDHLNVDNTNSFYIGLPDGFMRMMRVVGKIQTQGKDDINIFIDAANSPDILITTKHLNDDEKVFSEDSLSSSSDEQDQQNFPKDMSDAIMLNNNNTDSNLASSARQNKNAETSFNTAKILKLVILVGIFVMGIGAYFMMDIILPGSSALIATAAGTGGIIAAGTAAAILMTDDKPASKTNTTTNIKVTQPQRLAKQFEISRLSQDTNSPDAAPSQDTHAKIENKKEKPENESPYISSNWRSHK